MNLNIRNINDKTNIEYNRRHILHEFGHSLGFMHEH